MNSAEQAVQSHSGRKEDPRESFGKAQSGESSWQFKKTDWSKADLYTVMVLIVWGMVLNSFGLQVLEYFRHTEADRTLIAWEMRSRSEYFLPQLLGSNILTKPPLFYWAIAASQSVFNGVDEWIARFPSAIAATIFIILQFLALRMAGASLLLALGAAAALGSSAQFFILASVAEIDMLHGMFAAAAVYCAFFALSMKSLRFVVFASLAAALAFLTKGPPVVFFLAAGCSGFFVWQLFRGAPQKKLSQHGMFFVRALSVGAVVFLSVISLWLGAIASEVSTEVLVSEFQIEVLDRVLSEDSRSRGGLFYFGSLFVGLLPWSAIVVSAWVIALVTRERFPKTFLSETPRLREFFVFNGIVLICALLMLSVAEGKASRYLFPAHAFAINLGVLLLPSFCGRHSAKVFLAAGKVLCLLCIVAMLILPWVFHLPGVSLEGGFLTAATFVGTSLVLWKMLALKNWAGIFLAVALFAFPIRVGQTFVYSPHRNAERSVKNVAAKLSAAVPLDTPYYTLELAERSAVYYMRRLGKPVYRLTPTLAKSLPQERASVFLLVSGEEEFWRVVQVHFYDPTARVLTVANGPKEQFVVIEVSSEVLPNLQPEARFPTHSSKPFYKELSFLSKFGLKDF